MKVEFGDVIIFAAVDGESWQNGQIARPAIYLLVDAATRAVLALGKNYHQITAEYGYQHWSPISRILCVAHGIDSFAVTPMPASPDSVQTHIVEQVVSFLGIADIELRTKAHDVDQNIHWSCIAERLISRIVEWNFRVALSQSANANQIITSTERIIHA